MIYITQQSPQYKYQTGISDTDGGRFTIIWWGWFTNKRLFNVEEYDKEKAVW